MTLFRLLRVTVWLACLTLAGWLVYGGVVRELAPDRQFTFPQFVEQVRAGHVAEVEIEPDVARGRLLPSAPGAQSETFAAEVPDDDFSPREFGQLLVEHGVTVSYPRSVLPSSVQTGFRIGFPFAVLAALAFLSSRPRRLPGAS